jgi:hypothetical protein
MKFELGKVHSNPYARAFKPQQVVEADGDHEVGMAQGQLDYVIKSATELKGKLGGIEKNIPGWIQDHISKAHSYLHQANSGYHELGETETVNEATPLQKIFRKIGWGDDGWTPQDYARQIKNLSDRTLKIWYDDAKKNKGIPNTPLEFQQKLTKIEMEKRGLLETMKLKESKITKTYNFKNVSLTRFDEIDASFIRAGIKSNPDFNKKTITVSGDKNKIDKIVKLYKGIEESVLESKKNLYKKGDIVNYIPKLSGFNPKTKLKISNVVYDKGDEFTKPGWYYTFDGTNLRASEKDIKPVSPIKESIYTNQTGIKSSLLNNTEFLNLLPTKGFNWIRKPEVKIFHWKLNAFVISDGKMEMIVNLNKPMSVIKPLGRVRKEIKALFSENTSIKESNEEPKIITQLRDVVKSGYKKLKDPKSGRAMTVDSYSASAIVKVYDALKDPKNKEKFSSAGLLGMQSMAFKLIK